MYAIPDVLQVQHTFAPDSAMAAIILIRGGIAFLIAIGYARVIGLRLSFSRLRESSQVMLLSSRNPMCPSFGFESMNHNGRIGISTLFPKTFTAAQNFQSAFKRSEKYKNPHDNLCIYAVIYVDV